MRFYFVADDYGESHETNEAIERACSGGIIRSVTVIASDKSACSDLGFCANREIAVGLHLYLTGHPPISAEMKKYLKGDRCLSKRALVRGFLLGRIGRDHIVHEFDAQMAKLRELGIDPQFIDTHQNIHGLPFLFNIVRDFAKENGLEYALRPIAQLHFLRRKTVRVLVSKFWAARFNFKRRSRVLIGCPGYSEETLDIDFALESWDQFLTRLTTLDCEEIFVPCHPGFSPAEVELYLSPYFSELLCNHSIQPTNTIEMINQP
jgi:predicted glycoside hydrolase/deacetylase ChbG (UPF0249 family)